MSTVLKAELALPQSEANDLYFLLLQRCFKITRLGIQVLDYAKNRAERVGKFIGLPVDKIAEDLEMKSRSKISEAIDSLVEAGFLIRSQSYKDLYNLGSKQTLPDYVAADLRIDLRISQLTGNEDQQ